MRNVQGNQALAKRQKMLKKLENSSTKTVAEPTTTTTTITTWLLFCILLTHWT
jgi:hypothetical protein